MWQRRGAIMARSATAVGSMKCGKFTHRDLPPLGSNAGTGAPARKPLVSARQRRLNGIGGYVTRTLRIAHCSRVLAVGLLVLCGAASAPANPPPAPAGSSAPTGTAALTPQGSFLSSLRQGFAQDWEHEIVRGQFEVGSGSDAHRYYCLVNPKTGKREEYGVAGDLVPFRNGMTGIKGVAVTPFRCADAEQQGLLVTTGYVVPANLGTKPAPAVTPAPVAAAPAAAAVVAAPVVAAPPVSAAVPADGSEEVAVTAVFTRFIAGQNARDRAAVSQVLLDSKEFVLGQSGGNSVWGYKESLDAFEAAWQGTWILDPQTKELRIASASPGTCVLVTPLLFTQGPAGKTPSTVAIRWSGVFVKTPTGWRISSIFVTPFASWRAAPGG
jgi:SnoaL-like domain